MNECITSIGAVLMVTMAQSAANWRNTVVILIDWMYSMPNHLNSYDFRTEKYRGRSSISG